MRHYWVPSLHGSDYIEEHPHRTPSITNDCDAGMQLIAVRRYWRAPINIGLLRPSDELEEMVALDDGYTPDIVAAPQLAGSFGLK